jgi:hypothetical protein
MLISLNFNLSSNYFPQKIIIYLSGGNPIYYCILVLTISIESVLSTSKVIVFPVKVLTIIYIPPLNLNTKWRVDSF